MTTPLPDLLRTVLGPGVDVVGHERVGRPGVFSETVRAHLRGSAAPAPTVIVKHPANGANHTAALDSGAYRREALAYRELGPTLGDLAPDCLGVIDHADGGHTFVLEDLAATCTLPDQLDGLGLEVVVAAATGLADWHSRLAPWATPGTLDVRRNTPTAIPLEAARAGLVALEREDRRRFGAVLDRRAELLEAFVEADDIVLCHGDPRADNLAVTDGGSVRFFDFQQLAVQRAGADLAWLVGTSVRADDLDEAIRLVVEAYARAAGMAVSHVSASLRRGAVLPATAVLLLVQREITDERSAAMVRASVERIARLADLTLLDG